MAIKMKTEKSQPKIFPTITFTKRYQILKNKRAGQQLKTLLSKFNPHQNPAR